MKRKYLIVALLYAIGCYLLFNIFYTEVRKTAIRNLNIVQQIQAKQSGISIEEFFSSWTKNLTALSAVDEIQRNNPIGDRYLKLFYEAHQDQISEITRLNEKGIITYDYPLSGRTGSDISRENHILTLLRLHKPVVSDVLTTGDGTKSIALYVPIFRGEEFKGSLAIHIKFKIVAKRYFEGIRIHNTRMAWVVSRDGTLLYSPVPGYSGKPVSELIRKFPSVEPMLKDMLRGQQGTAEYMFDSIGSPNTGMNKKYALYMPLHIENTFWSICVTTNENDVLSSLVRFRNKLLLLIGALFIFGMVISVFGIKAWLIIKDREKRKEMEKELRKSELRFRSIIDNLQDAYFEIDKNGIIRFASPSGSKMYGYKSPREMIGLHVDEFYVKHQDREKLLKEIALKGTLLDYVCKGLKYDHQKFWVSMNAQYQYDQNGEISGIAAVVRDISERKNVEEKLMESESKYRNIYDNALEGMHRTSLDGKYLHANKALAKMTGYKSAEDILKNVTDAGQQIWITAEERQKFLSLFEKTDVVLDYECRFRRVDGRIIWVSLNTRLIRDKKGRPLYLEGFVEDITTRKESEEIIRKKMIDLQWYYDISVERELKMVELKKEINELLMRAGKEKRYFI